MLDKFFSKIEHFVPSRWRWILNHEGFRRYFTNTGWMFGGQIFFLALSFFVGAWMARYLGPHNYGILNYAISFAGVFAIFSSLGVDGILSRDLVKYPEKRAEFLGTAFGLKLLGGVLAFGAATAAALTWEADPLLRILIILFSLSFILQAINVIAAFFQADVRAKNNVRVQMAAAAISALLKIILIIAGGGIIWLIIIYVLESLWQGLGFIYVYQKAGQRIGAWHFNKELARQLWRQSWLLLLSGAAGLILARIDQVIIGRMLGQTAVGFYAVAVKVAEVFYFVPGIISGSLFPAIVNAKKIGADFYRRRLRNFYGLMGILAVAAAGLIFILARPIIIWLFGLDYEPSVGILYIYVWSGIGAFIGWAAYQHLLSEDRLRLILIANLLAMLINIVLNLFFIPLWGLKGAALANLISYFISPAVIFICLAVRRPDRRGS